MKKLLCTPCKIDLADRGKKITLMSAGRDRKGTCAACKRRRYVAEYDVTGRARRK